MIRNPTITKKINILIISVLTAYIFTALMITAFVVRGNNSDELNNLYNTILTEKKGELKNTGDLLFEISSLSKTPEKLIKVLNTKNQSDTVHIYLINKKTGKIVFSSRNCSGESFSCLGWNGFENFTGDKGFVKFSYEGFSGEGYYKKSSFSDYIFAVAPDLSEISRIYSARKEKLGKSLFNKIVWLIVISVSLLTLVLIVSTYISMGISKKIKNASDHLRDIAEGEGDLTKRLIVKSNDEIGELAGWFNVFIEKVQKVFMDVSQNAENIKRSSFNLFSISGDLSTGVQNTSLKSDQAAKASETVSERINAVAAAMKKASSNIANVAAAAEQMSSTISEVARNTEAAHGISRNAVSQAEDAALNVQELNKAALDIDLVTENIAEISEQTNLLALNATIEAARAGEAGKGFAVVANEVKNLANQTVDATIEIRGKILDIQQKTEGTIGEIEEISGIINNVNDIVSSIAAAMEEQSVTTREIAENVAQTSGGISEISGKVGTNSVVIREIANDIYDVHTAADNMASGNDEINKSAEELNKMAEELKKLVNKFKV